MRLARGDTGIFPRQKNIHIKEGSCIIDKAADAHTMGTHYSLSHHSYSGARRRWLYHDCFYLISQIISCPILRIEQQTTDIWRWSFLFSMVHMSPADPTDMLTSFNESSNAEEAPPAEVLAGVLCNPDALICNFMSVWLIFFLCYHIARP